MSEPTTSGAWGLGLATVSDATGRLLDTLFPDPRLGDPDPNAANPLAGAAHADARRGVRLEPEHTVIEDLAAPPAGVEDAYLRLHLLSHRLVQPRAINLDGIFGVLPNIAWTNHGPV